MEGYQNKPTFCEWFDPHKIDHIKAYTHLQNTGMWPDGFKLEKIYMEIGWQMILAFKIANAWIEYKLANESLNSDLDEMKRNPGRLS